MLEQALVGIAETFGVGLSLVMLVLGVVVLLYGRRLFWAFGGLLGFYVGLAVAPTLLANVAGDVRPLFILGIAVVAAVIFAALQRTVIQLAGGIAFALVGWDLAAAADQFVRIIVGVAMFVAGLVLALRLSDWAALVASALLGSMAIINVLVSYVALPALVPLVLFVAIAVFGIYRQSRDLRAS
jgi:hypothetical protein